MVTHSSYDASFSSCIVNMKDGEIFNEEHTTKEQMFSIKAQPEDYAVTGE